MNLDLDPVLVIKIAAVCIAVFALLARVPSRVLTFLHQLLPGNDAVTKRIDCKIVDTAWRSLIDASIDVQDPGGVDLLNQWMAGYNTRQWEDKS